MSDVQSYDHNQSSASTTWTINHALGTDDVAVDCFIDLGGSPQEFTKAIPVKQEVLNTNQVEITWSVNQSGRARVVGGGSHT